VRSSAALFAWYRVVARAMSLDRSACTYAPTSVRISARAPLLSSVARVAESELVRPSLVLSKRLADSRGTETVESMRATGCAGGDTTGADSVAPTAGAESRVPKVLGAWLLSVEFDILATVRRGVSGLTDETLERVRARVGVSAFAVCSGVLEIRELSATRGGGSAWVGPEASTGGIAPGRGETGVASEPRSATDARAAVDTNASTNRLAVLQPKAEMPARKRSWRMRAGSSMTSGDCGALSRS